MANTSDDIPWDEIQEHLFAGFKIQAIKLYREATGQSLKESKEFIDELEAKLKVEFPGHFNTRRPSLKQPAQGNRGAVVVLAVLIILGVLIFLFLAPDG